MKSVNIATFKAQLSKYLRAVKRGEEITVTDRNLPVAKVVPLQPATPFKLPLRKAPRPAAELGRLRFPPVRGRPTDTLAFLLEERGER